MEWIFDFSSHNSLTVYTIVEKLNTLLNTAVGKCLWNKSNQLILLWRKVSLHFYALLYVSKVLFWDTGAKQIWKATFVPVRITLII